MFLFGLVVGITLGGIATWYVTKESYIAKLGAIAAEVRDWEHHRIAEVRNFASRVKAFL